MTEAGTDPGSADPLVSAYARAILDVAEAEEVAGQVEDDLFRFARTLEGNVELRDRLTDPGVDVSGKLAVVDELLGGHPQSASAVMWVLQSGRIRQLTAIADALVAMAAAKRSRVVAEVRTAVTLSEERRRELAEALSGTTGQEVEVKTVVDPDIVGGVVVRIGDTVIDGSVARRLEELRASLTRA